MHVYIYDLYMFYIFRVLRKVTEWSRQRRKMSMCDNIDSRKCVFVYSVPTWQHVPLPPTPPKTPRPSSTRHLTSGNDEPHLAYWWWCHLVVAKARHRARSQYPQASVVLFNERIWANIWLPGGVAATPCRPGVVLPLPFKPGGIKEGPWISKVTKT